MYKGKNDGIFPPKISINSILKCIDKNLLDDVL
jgi:hypothetical protein